ncbi:hypothetical protein [Agrobacterium pusense]|uniref:hypothetical protein n=1 Tax=Agrobacterium pusense TaxID=648995 RepID=UPI000882BCB9|nr:hypothetical protein [Agrobacterium pusense]OOO17897.1 hypothetical protein BTE56_17040 [Agrobacterium pusense]WKD44367.1 hypothetical protein M8C82_01830 [Agrobacterium pusense]SDF62693.1 hypothetical protein SAMN05421750_11927 [Agrobacterium pusense]
MATNFSEALSPLAKRVHGPVRDIEILRLATLLDGDDFAASANAARNAVLKWASSRKRAGGTFPREAWEHADFELVVGGRNSTAVRFLTESADLWALRAEVPDENIPGRVWTNEIVIGGEIGKRPHLSIRLIVSTAEPELTVEHHVPGLVLQIATAPGLTRGGRTVVDTPRTLRSENEVRDLCDHLEDPERRLPIIIVTLPGGECSAPLINDTEVARALTGLAQVVRIPQELTWLLTARFGKFRSVFDGAVRAYLPGFSSADDPYSHRLFLATWLQDSLNAANCGLWLRRVVADLSVSSTRLGKDVVEFAAVRTASRRLRKDSLAEQKAPDAELLALAQELIDGLEKQLSEKDKEIGDYVAEVEVAEDRAKAAEQENRSLVFKIRQLQDALSQGGDAPTAEQPLPQKWSEFSDWLDQTFPDRVVLTPAARRLVRNPDFEDVETVARAINWLATDQHLRRLNGGGSTRDEVIEPGILNAYCGGDTYETVWQGRRYEVDQHVKNGGNSHDPKRCLRIYYFWEPDLQQTIIDHLPAHRRTSAT